MRQHLAERFRRARGWKPLLTVVTATLLGALLIPAAGASTRSTRSAHKNPICSRLGHVGVSAGAHMYCSGPVKPAAKSGAAAGRLSRSAGTPANVNAASPAEDIAQSGVRAYGQSEESVAASGKNVVEAWNDSTGFFVNSCSAPKSKENLTGYAFSNNGGKSFKDLGGLPNGSACAMGWKYYGDPSVETYTTAGKTYFYISSLYLNGLTGASDIAMDMCTVSGSGSSATLSCNSTPTIIATGAGTGPTAEFLDKDFLSVDPSHGRLYATFTRFSPTLPNGQVELAVCNISGSAVTSPTCYPGASPTPYKVLVGNQSCENEGAYPAVDPKTGAVYVAWEYNWATNFMTSACYTQPTQERLAYVPFSCLTLTPTSPCATPPLTTTRNITSMDLAFIPGFNRNPATAAPASDFPRIAVSDKAGTVTIVWNDARKHPTGDILMESYKLTPTTSFTAVQKHPVRLNNNKGATWEFMPGLRNADKSGLLNIIWFDRRNSSPACEACTDVYGALHVSPTATTSPATNVRITNVSSNWNASSSDIFPNYGDYTDDYVAGKLLQIAWADSRIGVPQPFYAHTGG